MVAERHRGAMSVEEYLALDRSSLEARYEFIDGYAYLLAGETANHSAIGVNVISAIHSRLRESPCRIYNSDLRVRLAETRYVYPDATVSCDARDRGQIDTIQYPRLAVEVLSPSTEGYDRGREFGYYRACPTMQEYVLVDTERQAIEVYRREADNLWTLHPFGPGDEVELGLIYERWEQPNEAQSYYTKALELAEAGGFLVEQSYALRHLAGLAEDAGDLEQALALFTQSLALRAAAGYRILLPLSHLAVGDVLLEQHDLARAAAHYQAAYAISQEMDTPVAQIFCLLSLGSLHKQQQEFAPARSYFEQARASAQEIDFPMGIAEASRALEEIAKIMLEPERDEKLFQANYANKHE